MGFSGTFMIHLFKCFPAIYLHFNAFNFISNSKVCLNSDVPKHPVTWYAPERGKVRFNFPSPSEFELTSTMTDR